MARKYDLISELYDRTCASVSENPLNWQGLLRTASYNFRLRFDEQLLLYAQRPDATAVLPIERWNGSFGRWVNRGAKGIAVFEDENRQRQRLTHYFDISDTHGSRYARPVPLWQMKLEYESDVAETLENTFGEADDNSTLESIIEGCVGNAVDDQYCRLPCRFAEFAGRFSRAISFTGRSKRHLHAACEAKRGVYDNRPPRTGYFPLFCGKLYEHRVFQYTRND